MDAGGVGVIGLVGIAAGAGVVPFIMRMCPNSKGNGLPLLNNAQEMFVTVVLPGFPSRVISPRESTLKMCPRHIFGACDTSVRTGSQ